MPEPAFSWDEWYARVGGRSIRIDAVDEYLREIREDAVPALRRPGRAGAARVRERGGGRRATSRRRRAQLGADIVGICRDRAVRRLPRPHGHGEVRDRGRTAHALARVPGGALARVGHRVPARLRDARRDRDRAWPSTCGRSAGPCTVEHPIGDSDLLHVPIGLKAGFGELGRHGSIIHPELGPLFRMGSVDHLDAARHRPPDRRGHREVLRHLPRLPDLLPAGRHPRRAQPGRRGRTTWATTATWSTPAAASRTSRSTTTARSACPSASTTTRSGRATSRAARPKLFPTVVMAEPPPPVDLPRDHRHGYEPLQREPSVVE